LLVKNILISQYTKDFNNNFKRDDMQNTKLALFLVIISMFSLAFAETDQFTFTITVEQNLPDWANLQFPTDTTIVVGDSCNFYAQVNEDGKTDGEGQFTDIQAWIGYNSNDVGTSDTGWTWLPATYNALASSEVTNAYANDEYYLELSSTLPIGTYYIASRFAFVGDSINATYGLTGSSTNAVLTIEKAKHAPILTAIADTSVMEDRSLIFVLSASDADDDTLTYSLYSNDQSDDITATVSHDTIMIVPDADFYTSVDATIIVKVSDGNGGEDTTSFKLTVNAVNDAPIIAAVANQEISEGSELTVNFTATDVDNSAEELTWSQSGKPTGSVFTDNGDGSAKLVWTPDYTQAGTYSNIQITVDDASGSSSSIIIKTDTNTNK
jgi:Bacterial Ig domain